MRNRMSPELMKRKGEVLVEAGRLAAEYLVSQGRLPPAVLSATRTSALARLGTTSTRRFTLETETQTQTQMQMMQITPPPPEEEKAEKAQEEEEEAGQMGELNLKEIEVIDLENDSPVGGETETAAEGDGYGLMISELLDNNINIQDQQQQQQQQEDDDDDDDDSIYMSLGEIPLTYLGRPPWEQPPTQDYDKPF